MKNRLQRRCLPVSFKNFKNSFFVEHLRAIASVKFEFRIFVKKILKIFHQADLFFWFKKYRSIVLENCSGVLIPFHAIGLFLCPVKTSRFFVFLGGI